MLEEEHGAMEADGGPARGGGWAEAALEPVRWVRMLCRELGATFVAGVVLVYDLNQGFAGSFFRVASDYYWKDVQRVQPATVQFLSIFFHVPWVLKPLWGVMTDVLPVRGYRRRPYFVFSGMLGMFSTAILAMGVGLSVTSAVVCFVGISTAVAIADVTIDACIAKNSIDKPALAPDMQSLCAFSLSLGALIGYATSGMFVHHLGAQGALGVMALPPIMLVFLGFYIYELKMYQHNMKEKVLNKVAVAVKGMVQTIKYPVVWKPSLYMFLSLALSISTHEGQFYWYTNKEPPNPGFSQEFVGMVHAVGAGRVHGGRPDLPQEPQGLPLPEHPLLRPAPARRLGPPRPHLRAPVEPRARGPGRGLRHPGGVRLPGGRPRPTDADDGPEHQALPAGRRGHLLRAAHVHRQPRHAGGQDRRRLRAPGPARDEDRFQQPLARRAAEEPAEAVRPGRHLPGAHR